MRFQFWASFTLKKPAEKRESKPPGVNPPCQVLFGRNKSSRAGTRVGGRASRARRKFVVKEKKKGGTSFPAAHKLRHGACHTNPEVTGLSPRLPQGWQHPSSCVNHRGREVPSFIGPGSTKGRAGNMREGLGKIRGGLRARVGTAKLRGPGVVRGHLTSIVCIENISTSSEVTEI